MPRFIYMYMPERGKSEGLRGTVGAPRFELGTSWSQTTRANQTAPRPGAGLQTDCRLAPAGRQTLESRIPRFSSCYLAWLQLPTPPRNPRLHVESAENIVSFRYRCYYSLQASYRLQGMISPWGWPVERACTTT